MHAPQPQDANSAYTSYLNPNIFVHTVVMGLVVMGLLLGTVFVNLKAVYKLQRPESSHINPTDAIL